MAKINLLSDTQVRRAKSKEKLYRLNDGAGLSLEVPPGGLKKRWRFRYEIKGKSKMISVGTYPEISLKAARERRTEYRSMVALGLDPSEERKKSKEAARQIAEEGTRREERLFETAARRYLEHYRPQKNEAYWRRVELAFERDVFPFIGEKELDEVSATDLVEIVNRIQGRGAIETAHRIFTQISRVYKFALSQKTGLCSRNPATDIDIGMVLLERAPDRYPTITAPDEVGRLLRAIDGYTGAYPVRMALAFAPYVAVRPRNLRLARWEQIDWEKRLWIIPAEEMKGKEEHLVPLTDSSLKILEEVRRYSGGGELIFPSTRSPGRPMSDVTLARALARMGYGGEKMVPHGFRSMFSTVAHEESGFSHEAIEYQLAHRVGSRVSHAYNRALYLEERRQLMQWWSDWLDRVKLNGNDE